MPRKPRTKRTPAKKKVEKVEVEIPKEVPVKKVEQPKTVQKVLYAVDSPAYDERIKIDSRDPMKRVTVLVKSKYSGASVDTFLKSGDLKLIDTFSGQFDGEEYDVAFVEKEMMDKVPENILKKLK